MNPYFWNGLQHALAGLGCAWGFFVLTKLAAGRPSADLPEPDGKPAGSHVWFWGGLVMGSSALFFVPAHIGRPGTWVDWLWQFTHYPVPDWDILWLGMPWHRWFLTHSALVPFVVIGLTFEHRLWRAAGYGLAIGIASHLAWDAITQGSRTPIVFLPDGLALRGEAARLWLLINAAIAFGIAVITARQHPMRPA
ncbi:hypothetical protein J8C06_13075 [Chloracidobacterium validum]|uniref:DUF5942 domain-containing protein n=1 Tax=Chloracidobacterium validum TaxID=2821543 RepID=A0ABX8BE68_9BACT|nr:DUF5942 domain-containing protein [Chloracidobacterium validum]QUW04697.1 hypothetical protein J8C06_13075 [Chloracidobacterium validum]